MPKASTKRKRSGRHDTASDGAAVVITDSLQAPRQTRSRTKAAALHTAASAQHTSELSVDDGSSATNPNKRRHQEPGDQDYVPRAPSISLSSSDNEIIPTDAGDLEQAEIANDNSTVSKHAERYERQVRTLASS